MSAYDPLGPGDPRTAPTARPSEESLAIPRLAPGRALAHLYRPAGTGAPLPVILAAGGGAEPGGDPLSGDTSLRSLARLTNAAVVQLACGDNAGTSALDDDCFTASSWLAAHGHEAGLDGTRLALVGLGEAAGAMARAARMATAWGSPKLTALVLAPSRDEAESPSLGPQDTRDFAALDPRYPWPRIWITTEQTWEGAFEKVVAFLRSALTETWPADGREEA
ncbi:hypothetical protein ACWD5Q_14990 [Streptomyces sp. NPDC002513]